MRPEGGNPLDLNNTPDEYSRDGKQILQASSSSAGCSSSSRKKKSGVKDGKDECGKVYECRFCSLKFCKSQALGGHMNRHRQERETETLNHARQLVFRNDHNLTSQVAPRLGCCQPIAQGSYVPASNIGDPKKPLKFPKYLSASSSISIMPPRPSPPPPPHPQQPFLYTSPTRPFSSFSSSHYPHHHHHPHHHYQHSVNDYYVGHVLSSSSTQKLEHHNHHNLINSSNYTCIGAPVGQAFLGGSNNKDKSLHNNNQEEGLSYWGRSFSSGTQLQRLDPSSVINRFQDGF